MFLLFRKVILPFRVLNAPLKKMAFGQQNVIFFTGSCGWMVNLCKIMCSFKYEISGFLWTGLTFPLKQSFQISKKMLELSLSKTTAFQSGEN